MKSKGIFLILCIVHIITLVLLIVVQKKADVFEIFALVFIPLLVSLVIAFWGQLSLMKEGHVSVKNVGVFYSIPNIVYLSVASFIISKNIDSIFLSSQKYQSEYMSVSTSNSPWFAYFILLALSIALHYVISNLGLRKSKGA